MNQSNRRSWWERWDRGDWAATKRPAWPRRRGGGSQPRRAAPASPLAFRHRAASWWCRRAQGPPSPPSGSLSSSSFDSPLSLSRAWNNFIFCWFFSGFFLGQGNRLGSGSEQRSKKRLHLYFLERENAWIQGLPSFDSSRIFSTAQLSLFGFKKSCNRVGSGLSHSGVGFTH